MIPKIIHYCWFGGNPLPPLAIKCIESWKKYLPDYQIKEWNEQNFDVNIIPYTQEAYLHKKYAFVSDYARFWIIYKYGGIYFDTDVEIIKPIDDIISKGSYMGCEREYSNYLAVNPGLGFGCIPNLPFLKEMMTLYESLHFCKDGTIDYKNIVAYTTEALIEKGFTNKNKIQTIEDINIYSSDYFSPLDTITKRLHITSNTRTIHHFAASWINKKDGKFKEFLRKYIPEYILIFYNNLKKYI